MKHYRHVALLLLTIPLFFFSSSRVLADTGICEAVAPAHCYYVAPDGSDSNAGTFGAPFKTFQPAIIAAMPGDFIYARGGTYTSANSMLYVSYYASQQSQVMISIQDYWGSTIPKYTVRNGLPGQPITIKNYPGEVPMFTQTSHINIDKSYWTISGFDIDGSQEKNTSDIYITGNSHDIIIENNNIHDFVSYGGSGNNVGMIKIDRADKGGAYNIFISNNKFHGMSDPSNPGVWHGVADFQHYGAVTVLSAQVYVNFAAGGTGYIEITGNEMYNLPQAFFFKNPMDGPIEIHGNIIHDSDTIALADASNVHFNHNLVYAVPDGFWGLGFQESTDPNIEAIEGQNEIIQNNTFVGLNNIMNIGSGEGNVISNNIFFGMNGETTGAGWDTPAYISKSYVASDPVSPALSILQKTHSDQNCFITPSSDTLFVKRNWNTGNPSEFDNYTTANRLYGFDTNSKFIIQSDPTKIFVSPSSNNYSLIDSGVCPDMGAGSVTPPSLPTAPAPAVVTPVTPTTPPVVTPPVTVPAPVVTTPVVSGGGGGGSAPTPTPTVSSGGGGGGGGSSYSIPPTSGSSGVTNSNVSATALKQQIISLIIANRALILEAQAKGIYVPSSLIQILDTGTLPATTSSGTNTVSTYAYTRDLYLGLSGPDVTALQSFLMNKDAGPRSLELKVHGATKYFGQLTKAALIEYQKSVGINPTGYFGSLTKRSVSQ